MKYRLILLFLCVFFTSANVWAQQFNIERVEALPLDLTAATLPRMSLANEACALIKFEVPSSKVKFQGNIVGDVKYDVGEYLVYVSPGTRMIRAMHDLLLPLTIDFAEYGISSLNSKCTYVVTLSLPFNTETDNSNKSQTKYLYAFRDSDTGYLGLKNSLDEIVVDAIYEQVEFIQDEKYVVVVLNGKVGLLNLFGAEMLPCEYDFGIQITDDFIVCKKDEVCGIVDYSNKCILPFEYDEINVYGGSHQSEILSLKKDGKYTICNAKDFVPKTDFIFDKIESGRMLYDNGIISVYNPSQSKLFAVKMNDKWGFIDEEANYVIKPQFDDGEDYRNRIIVNGTAAVCKDGKYGIINDHGETVVPFKYERIFMQLNDAPDIYYFAKDDKGYEIFSTQGNKITRRYYEELDLCNDGMVSFKEDGKCGVLDLKTGKHVFDAIYDDVHSYGFGENKIMVKKDGKWGCVDRHGNEVFGFYYDDVYGFSNGIARVKRNDKWGLIKTNGLLLVDCLYSNVTYLGQDRLAGLCNEHGKWALVNIKGIVVTDFEYDQVNYNCFMMGDFTARRVRKNGKYGYIDFKGNEIIPCLYHDEEIESILFKYLKDNNIDSSDN